MYSKRKDSIPDQRFSSEGFIFNLLSALYFMFIAPFIGKISNSVLTESSINYGLGIGLIMLSVMEVIVLPKKMKFVNAALKAHSKESSNGIFYLWIFHAIVSVIISMMSLEAFGIDIQDKANNTLFGAIMMIVVLKELYILFMLMDLEGENEKYSRPNNKEIRYDIILLLYSWIAYTVTWENISYNSTSMNKDDLPMYIVNLIAAGIVFLIFYLPIRIPYLVEEIALLKSYNEKLKFYTSLLLVLASVLFSL